MENNKNYMKGFVPYAVAAAILSLCGGFTASVPTAISTAWNADASLTFITLAYSLAAAAMAPIMGKLGGAIGRRKMLLGAMALYTVGQALIAICPQNVPLLLVFRFMVGIGAAGIAPVVMSYIMMEFPPEKMGQGFTIYHGAGLRHGHLWTHPRRYRHESHRHGQRMAYRHVDLRRTVRDFVPHLLCKSQG